VYLSLSLSLKCINILQKKKKKKNYTFLVGVLYVMGSSAALKRVLSLFFSLFNETGYIHRVVTLLSLSLGRPQKEKRVKEEEIPNDASVWGRVHHHPPHTHKAKKGKTFTVHSVALLPFLLQVPKRADGPRKRDTRFSPEARKGNADMKRRPSRAINRLSFEQLVDKTPGQHFSIGNDYKTGREVRRERTNDQGRQVHFINLDSVPGRGQPSDNRQTVLDRPWPVRPRMARLPNNTYLSIGQMNKKERTGSTMATC
jgi:hypothetical protein